MRRIIRPIGLLFTTLFLSLIFINSALAFECTNAGAGSTAPDDGGLTFRTACGDSAVVSGPNGTAVGGSALASGESGTAVGITATASGVFSTALGGGSTASGDGNTAVGVLAKALTPYNNATALGFRAQVEQSNAMVLGSIPGLNSGVDFVDVSIGTSTPDAPLHIFRDDETLEFMFLESDAAGGAQDRAMMQLSNNGGIRFQFDNTLTGDAWRFQAGTGNEDNFEITKVGTGELELLLQNDGDLFITGSLTQNSDVNAKQNIEVVDGQMLLAKLDTLPVAEWTYKRDSSGARHLGPMAQDFHAAFGLGEDETKIAPGDMAGISLAAIKALRKELQNKNAELAAQQNQIIALADRLADLEALAGVRK